MVATFLHGSVTALLKNLGLHSITSGNIGQLPSFLSSGVFSLRGSASCDATCLNMGVQREQEHRPFCTFAGEKSETAVLPACKFVGADRNGCPLFRHSVQLRHREYRDRIERSSEGSDL